MKKLNTFFVLILLLTIVPSIALASWWNPFSWFNSWGSDKKEEKTEILEKKIQELEAKLASTTPQSEQSIKEDLKPQVTPVNNIPPAKTQAQIDEEVNARVQATLKAKQEQEALLASQQTPVVSPSPAPVTVPVSFKRPVKSSGEIDLGKYNQLNVLDYIKNSKASLGKPVKIISGFVAGFNQGRNNYMVLGDITDTSPIDTINLLIEDDNDYTEITNELEKMDRILIYGFGEEKVKFNIVGDGGSYESYEPVISVDAVYICKYNSDCKYPYNVGVDEIFMKEI